MGLQIFDERVVHVEKATFDSGTVDNQNIFTAGPAGSRMDSLLLASDDTVDNTLFLTDYDPDSGYQSNPLATFTVPAGAGFTGPVVDLVAALAPLLGGYIAAPRHILQFIINPVPSSAKTVWATAVGGDF